MQGGGWSWNAQQDSWKCQHVIHVPKKGIAIRDVHISLKVGLPNSVQSWMWKLTKLLETHCGNNFKCGLKPMAVACYRNPCYWYPSFLSLQKAHEKSKTGFVVRWLWGSLDKIPGCSGPVVHGTVVLMEIEILVCPKYTRPGKHTKSYWKWP